MATDRYPVWAAEYAGTSSGPTAAQVLSLFAAVALILGLVLGMAPATHSGDQPTRTTSPPPCAQHFPPTCQESSHGR